MTLRMGKAGALVLWVIPPSHCHLFRQRAKGMFRYRSSSASLHSLCVKLPSRLSLERFMHSPEIMVSYKKSLKEMVFVLYNGRNYPALILLRIVPIDKSKLTHPSRTS